MTQEQVARRADVSTATVSRILNNKGPVSSAVRARVMKVVEELKYHPNLHARGLAGSGRSIGVIVSNLENPFFLDIYKAVEAGAVIAGFDVIMANTGYDPERLVTSVRSMIGRRVTGLAAIVSEMDPGLMAELNEYRIPTVFYDVGAPGPNIANIRVNYRHGMERLIGSDSTAWGIVAWALWDITRLWGPSTSVTEQCWIPSGTTPISAWISRRARILSKAGGGRQGWCLPEIRPSRR